MWPAVQDRVPCGRPLFKAVNRGAFNRALKAIFARLQVPHAARYGSHAFRRGSAQGMNDAGSPLSVVASAAMWRSNALVGNYIDMASTVEANARRLSRVDFGSESDMEVHLALGLGMNLLHRPAQPLFLWVSGFFCYISPGLLSGRFGAVKPVGFTRLRVRRNSDGNS